MTGSATEASLILDRMDGNADAEDGRDVEPALTYQGDQVAWLRNNDSGSETEAHAVGLPVVAAESTVIPFAPLPWRGSGNVVAAAGVALLEMVAGR